MNISDIVTHAVKGAIRGRFKTFLSALSIAIGVASVLIISSLGESGAAEVERQIERLGISGITIYRNAPSGSQALSTEDAVYLKEKINTISFAVPVMIQYGNYKIKALSGNTVIWGVGDLMEKVLDVKLKYGRFPSALDIKYAARVAVIDDMLAKKAYNRDNIVGKDIKLTIEGRSETFKIIGIIENQKSAMNMLVGDVIPEFVYIPFDALGDITKVSTADQIVIKCTSNSEINKTQEAVIKLLNRRNGTDNGYLSENISGYKENLSGLIGLVSMIVSAVAAISLCVAGLGIMNNMLSTAIERRREIGICMAIGARRRDISLCFLVESIVICSIGGIAGIIIGSGLSLVITTALGIDPHISLMSLAVSQLTALGCGMLFGIIPAVRASGLDPIVALRD